MKKERLFKSDLSGTLGLTCLETYLLYVLKKHDPMYSLIYYNSFVEFSELFTALVYENIEYTYFDRIGRLQRIAAEHNLIQSVFIKYFPEPALIAQYDYVCISVTPDYIGHKYGLTLWRDEHFYLFCRKNERSWYYINDTPRDEGVLSVAELKKNAREEAFLFSFASQISGDQKKLFYRRFIEKLPSSTKREKIFDTQGLEYSAFRDLVGLLRVTRKRMLLFLRHFADIAELNHYTAYLDRVFAKLEYARLRNTYNAELASELITEIICADAEYLETVKQVTREIKP